MIGGKGGIDEVWSDPLVKIQHIFLLLVEQLSILGVQSLNQRVMKVEIEQGWQSW